MDCPVCDADMSDMSSELQMHHVNRCLDDDENASQAANQLAEHKFDACPICFKDAECHIEHLKKCAKQKSIFPKDLVHVIQAYEKQTGARLKVRKKAERKKKEVTAKTRKQGKNVKQTEETDMEEIIPMKKTEIDSTSSKSLHFAKAVTVKNGRLTTCSEFLDRNEMQTKLDQLLSGSIILNFSASTPTELPAMFRLSSLVQPHAFVARGFQKLVHLSAVRPLKEPASSPVRTGFLQEADGIDIDHRKDVIDRLWKQKNKKSADMLIKTREQVELACHSFVWCMNTGKPHLTRCGSMFRVDCSPFSKQVVDTFITFCYSGRMRVEAEMESEMRSFLSRFECDRLLK